MEAEEGCCNTGAGAGDGNGQGGAGARLEASYLDAQARCVRLTDGKRSRLDKVGTVQH